MPSSPCQVTVPYDIQSLSKRRERILCIEVLTNTQAHTPVYPAPVNGKDPDLSDTQAFPCVNNEQYCDNYNAPGVLETDRGFSFKCAKKTLISKK